MPNENADRSLRCMEKEVDITCTNRFAVLEGESREIGVFCDDEDIHTYYRLYLPQTVAVTVQEGLCVLIPCQFTIKATQEAAERPRGYWFIRGDDWDGPAVASNDGTRAIREDTRGRFKLVGDLTLWDCSLRIDDVSTRDTGTYYFRYEHSRRSSVKYNYNLYPLRVTVVDLKDKPEISLPDRVIEGEKVTVECRAPGRCSGTAPEITWSFESKSEYNQSFYNTDNLNGTKTNKSTITFTASRDHNNTHLSCTTYFPAVRKQSTSSITLTVEYPSDAPEIFINKTQGVSTAAITGILVASILVLALLVGVPLCVNRKIRKRSNTGNRNMSKASNDTTVDSTYQELQRRQPDIYCELKRDGK
ncbi:sialic acid-binding Ig-like lectin 13 [Lissotriton helveticus]